MGGFSYWHDGPGYWSKLSVREAQIVALLRRGPMTRRAMADALDVCRTTTHYPGDQGDDLHTTVRVMMHRLRKKGVVFERRCGGYWALSEESQRIACLPFADENSA